MTALPSVTSTIFPGLPKAQRTHFRVALIVVLVVLAASALLRWQPPLIAVISVGIPLLFVAYLCAADFFAELPRRVLITTAVLGIALGVSWARLTGDFFADAYDVLLTSGLTDVATMLRYGAVELGGVLVMLVPVAVARAVFGSTRKSLDGYAIGGLGALAFTAAVTATLAAPQMATGLIAQGPPVTTLLAQAAIWGVATPLIAAAVGGLFGLALWFGGPARVAVAVAFGLLLSAAGYVTDFLPITYEVQMGLYLVVVAVALLALRIGLRATSVRAPGEPSTYRAVSDRRMWVTFASVLAGGVAAVAVVSLVVTPGPPRYVCPPDCGRPPLGEPVETNPRFTSASGDFSVTYPGNGSLYEVRMNPNGVVLNFTGGDTGKLELFGEPSRGRTPRQIAEELIKARYPNANTAYEIPNAMVGYEPGFGIVADDYPQDANASYTRLRILVMAAEKNGLALIAAAVGPYHQFSPDFGTGHPSGANLQIAMDMGKYVNSFTWRGDPPG
jgi:hypothetical protein